jgi:UrcA family protein
MMHLALLVLAAAQAQTLPYDDLSRTQTQVVVSFADLDLGSAVDRATLEARIAAGARRACEEPLAASAAQRMRIAQCISTARSKARTDVEQALARQQAPDALASAEVTLNSPM